MVLVVVVQRDFRVGRIIDQTRGRGVGPQGGPVVGEAISSILREAFGILRIRVIGDRIVFGNELEVS
jgi:hypothetical protein